MAIEFKVKIFTDKVDETIFCACSEDASGEDCIICGHGQTPYDALHDLICEFENAELWRPD